MLERRNPDCFRAMPSVLKPQLHLLPALLIYGAGFMLIAWLLSSSLLFVVLQLLWLGLLALWLNAHVNKVVRDEISNADYYRRIFEVAPDVVTLTRLKDAKIIDINPRGEQLIGYRRHEILGKSSIDLNLWRYPEERQAYVELLTKTGTVQSYHAQMQDRHGKPYMMSMSASLFERNGEHFVLTFFRDITSLNIAQQQLRDTLSRLETLFEAAPEALTLVRYADGTFVACNKAAEQLTGYPRAQILGRSAIDIGFWQFNPEDRDRFIEMLKQNALLENFETTLVNAHGETRVCAINAAMVTVDSAAHILSYLRDVSHIKEQEKQLQKLNDDLESKVQERTAQLEYSNRELESFVYSVSHDLRGPVRAVIGFGQAVLEEEEIQASELAKSYLKRIADAGARMNHIIEALLRLSKLSRIEILRSDVDLSKMAQELVDTLWHVNSERDVEVIIEPGLHANADPILLRNVLDNLLNNAWKYTSRTEHARVHIGKKQMDDGSDCFFVQDNGAGFDMAFLHRLFLPFHRLHTEQEFSGTGVGLATVQRIIRSHGGRIWADAKVGQGATFYFTLPVQ